MVAIDDIRGANARSLMAALNKENSTMTGSGFTVDVDQNEYLPEGGREVSAIVTVASAADFAVMMADAMGKQVADVVLQVWTPQHATVKFVKQVAPAVEDLTGRRVPSGPQSGDYPTGAWGPGESRDYHLGVEVTPAGLGQEVLAARVKLLATSGSGSGVLGQGWVRVIWTDDEALSTKLNPGVAHYTGQAELAAAIQEGLEARKAGDEETATARLGRALALAHQAGNEDTAKLLAKLVRAKEPDDDYEDGQGLAGVREPRRPRPPTRPSVA